VLTRVALGATTSTLYHLLKPLLVLSQCVSHQYRLHFCKYQGTIVKFTTAIVHLVLPLLAVYSSWTCVQYLVLLRVGIMVNRIVHAIVFLLDWGCASQLSVGCADKRRLGVVLESFHISACMGAQQAADSSLQDLLCQLCPGYVTRSSELYTPIIVSDSVSAWLDVAVFRMCMHL
jgi:hypothetical protein